METLAEGEDFLVAEISVGKVLPARSGWLLRTKCGVYNSQAWILDTGAADHIVCSLSHLHNYRRHT
ncbi:unnamed protein product [Linum tenue]|uniref:Uncharacterized protein n=1 Tax=Linum tenue TaxID=586396 RepID=A0AAV0Q8I1_9ROSI|nr:unnamed protein product [Linum tenue]